MHFNLSIETYFWLAQFGEICHLMLSFSYRVPHMSHLELSSNISSSKNKNYMTFFGRSDNWRNLLPLWYCLPFSWYYNNKNHWRRSKDRNQSSNFDSDLKKKQNKAFNNEILDLAIKKVISLV